MVLELTWFRRFINIYGVNLPWCLKTLFIDEFSTQREPIFDGETRPMNS